MEEGDSFSNALFARRKNGERKQGNEKSHNPNLDQITWRPPYISSAGKRGITR